MILRILRDLLATGNGRTREEPRLRLAADTWPAAIYAVGDVHGCHAHLVALEAAIVADAAAIDGERWLVMLGDYIDRGPDSARVIAHLVGPPPNGFRRICIAGNHEQMLIEFLDDPVAGARWLDFGGNDTARSYGLRYEVSGTSARPRDIARDLELVIPEGHREFIRGLPVSISVPGFHFVHAGLRSGLPFDEQSDDDLLWLRMQADGPRDFGGATVVHGHTPLPEALTGTSEICVDTGVYASGVLTAVRLIPGQEPTFLSSRQLSDLNPR